jgi:tetratricopeptide (TPR) repeat protein
MLKKKHIQFNAFLIIIVFGLLSFSYDACGSDDAIKLFKQKKYEEALPLFNSLLQTIPNDPSLCYYTGICLTETNQFGKEAINFLLVAANGNQPFDVNFYLGKNYHALNDFKVAKTYYTIFGQKASSKEKKAFDLNTKIDLCERSINPFPVFQYIPKAAETTITSPEVVTNISVEEVPLEIPLALNDTIINFTLTSEIYYTRFYQFRTDLGKQNFIKGWNSSDTLNKLISETDSLRNEYGKTLSSEIKLQIANRVIDLETQIMKTKSHSDESYSKANESEIAYWKQAPEDEKWKLIAENDSIKNAEEAKSVVLVKPVEIPIDTLQVSDSIAVDSTATNPEELVELIAEPTKTSPVIYKIQIGKYNTDLPESARKLFKKISVLRKIDQYTDEKGFIVYTIGELTNLKDAVKLQDQIRQESVKDAFVIAIKDGKRITLSEALELTK